MKIARIRETGRLALIQPDGTLAELEDAHFLTALADPGAVTPTGAVLPADTPLAAPFVPGRVLCIGRNYAAHAEELGNAVPDEPVVFLKASSCVIGPGEAIVAPEWIGQVDYEGELLVILGAGGADVREEDAMDLVAGYTCFNDVTARAKSKSLQGKGHPWFLAKSRDTFGPLGPCAVPKSFLPDPTNIRVTLTVNGELRQEGTTAQMLNSIPALIAFLSKWVALLPGDVIATGTPPGVGSLKPGDTVAVTVEGIGTLENPVVGG